MVSAGPLCVARVATLAFEVWPRLVRTAPQSMPPGGRRRLRRRGHHDLHRRCRGLGSNGTVNRLKGSSAQCRSVSMVFQDRHGWHCQFLEEDLKTPLLNRHVHDSFKRDLPIGPVCSPLWLSIPASGPPTSLVRAKPSRAVRRRR